MDHITVMIGDEPSRPLRAFLARWANRWLLRLHRFVVASLPAFHFDWSAAVVAAARLATVRDRILDHRVVWTVHLQKDWLVQACFARYDALRAVCELWQHVVAALRVIAARIEPVFDFDRGQLRQVVLLLPLSLGRALVYIFIACGYLHQVLVNLGPGGWLEINILYELTILLNEVVLLVLLRLALSCLYLLTSNFLLLCQLLAFYVPYFRECEPLRQLQVSVPLLILLILILRGPSSPSSSHFLDPLLAHGFVWLVVELGVSPTSLFIHVIDLKLWLHVPDNRR